MQVRFLAGVLVGIAVMLAVGFFETQMARITRIENFLTAVSAGR